MTINNHPAHGPVSLDRLHQISEILSKAAAQSDGGNLGYAMADAVKVIDGAIAAFGNEPVAWIVHARTGDQLTTDGNYVANAEGILGLHSTPLYTAQLAPVVDADDNFYSWFGREWEQYYQPNNYSLSAKKHLGAIAESAWFSCRSAMLQDAETVTRDELPLDYLQGHKDGLEWAAQLAEANHPQTGDWLYDDPLELAKAIRKGPDMPEGDGNSPVTPDGWVMVPVEPTMAMLDEFDSIIDHGAEDSKDAWSRLIAAAPQQQNAPQNIPEIILGWIPVSERVPERDVDVQVYCADKKEQMVAYMERNEADGWFRFASLPNGGGVYCKPTHWMPLPAAPQQEMKR